MPPVNLAGNWAGMLVYGTNYRCAGEELFFNLNLEQDGPWIEGESKDLSGHGVNPLPAFFSGIVVGSAVYFIKQYLTQSGLSEQNFDEEARINFLRGPAIYYSGIYKASDDTVSGSWSFDKPFGKPAILSGLQYKGSGTWIMKRKQEHSNGDNPQPSPNQ